MMEARIANTFVRLELTTKSSPDENPVAGQSRLSGTAYRVLEIAAFIPADPAYGGTGHSAAF
jgi:hypothetical protein